MLLVLSQLSTLNLCNRVVFLISHNLFNSFTVRNFFASVPGHPSYIWTYLRQDGLTEKGKFVLLFRPCVDLSVHIHESRTYIRIYFHTYVLFYPKERISWRMKSLRLLQSGFECQSSYIAEK